MNAMRSICLSAAIGSAIVCSGWSGAQRSCEAADVNTVSPVLGTVPGFYSSAVLEGGCFSCYSTVPAPAAATDRPIAAAADADVPGMTQYAEIDTLVVFYPHYRRDYREGHVQVDWPEADMRRLRAEAAEAVEFFWRASNLKCLLNIDYMVVDRTLTPAQLWDWGDNGRYWLTYWSIDGGTSVERDLRAARVSNGQYSVVVVLYAFESSEGASAAVAGGAYGVDIGFLGDTAYIAIPVRQDLNRDGVIIHEYLHALDSIYTASGNPGDNNMGHADRPALFNYPADGGRHFSFLLCNVLEPQSWLQLDPRWARVATAADGDGDGVPDSGDLPITEQTLGSSAAKRDTDDDGLDDLAELTAVFYRPLDPRAGDTDGDGMMDGEDPYPLYWCSDRIGMGQPGIDGLIGAEEYTLVARLPVQPNPDIEVSVYSAWSDGALCVAADITDNRVQTPYQEPFWHFCDNFEINIDSLCTGWFSGRPRNYRFYVVPTGSQGRPQVFGRYGAYRGDSMDWNDIDTSPIDAKYALRPGGYIIEMAIPSQVMSASGAGVPDVRASLGASWRWTFSVRDHDDYADWPELSVLTGLDVTGFIEAWLTYGHTLVAADARKRVLVPVGPVSDAWRGGGDFDDSQWVDGAGGVGYELGTGLEPFFDIDVAGGMYGKNATCYVRIPFSLSAAELSRVTALALAVRCNDGFIACLNGEEVYRVNFTGEPAWNSAADVACTGTPAARLQIFDITACLDGLRAGQNILAIQGLNASFDSTDFLVWVELVASMKSSHGR